MEGVYYEFVETDVLDPATLLLQHENKDQRRNDQDVRYDCSHNTLLWCSLAPLIHFHLPIAQTNAENCSYPSKNRCSLQKSKPRANDLIISISNGIIVLIFSAL